MSGSDGFYDEFLDAPDDATPPHGIPVQQPPPTGAHATPSPQQHYQQPLPPPAPVPQQHSVGQVPGVFEQQVPGRHAQANPGLQQIHAADVIPRHKVKPEMGWRGRIARTTGVNLGVSKAEDEYKKLLGRVQRQLRSTYTVAFLSTKGGVGKSSATLLAGTALGMHREDRAAAIDANPDDGTLANRLPMQTARSFRELLADPGIRRFEDVREYMGSNQRGLWVLRGDDSERSDDEMSGDDFKHSLARVQIGFPLTLVDCGTGVRHPVTRAVLESVDAVVVVATARLDGADAAMKTLRWLHFHGYAHLVRNATVIVNEGAKGKAGEKEVGTLVNKFAQAVHAVHVLPKDPHLEEAGVVDVDRLQPRTQRVAIEIAASIADGFAQAADKDHTYGWGQR